MCSEFIIKLNSKDNKYCGNNLKKDINILNRDGILSDRHSCCNTKYIKKYNKSLNLDIFIDRIIKYICKQI